MNYKEIEKCISQMNLKDSQVQEIYQNDLDSYIFDLYSSKYKRQLLFVKLTGKTSRIHLIKDLKGYKKSISPRPKRFLTYLKANVKNKVIKDIKAIENDRIVKIVFIDLILYIRLYSASKANIIACDLNDTIIESAFKRVKNGNKFIIEKSKVFDCDDISYNKDDYNFYIEDYYKNIDKKENFDNLLDKVNQVYNKKISYLNNRLKSINNSLSQKDLDKEYENKAILLSTFRYLLKDFSKDALLDDVLISLNENLTINQNIDLYYKKARKERNKLKLLKEEKEIVLSNIKKINDEYENLIKENNFSLFSNYIDKKEEKKTFKSEFLTIKKDNCIIIIGKNDAENDKILRKAKGNDYWLHSRDTSGSHVFIKCEKNKSPSLEVILFASQLAIYYSKARNKTNADLYYTQVKYLKKVKNSIGKVIPTQEKNINIKVDSNIVTNYFKENIC